MSVIVIAPDSFKGSCDAAKVATAMADGVRAALPEAEVRLCPMADGGEGTLAAIRQALAAGGVGSHAAEDAADEADVHADKAVGPNVETHYATVLNANGIDQRVPCLILRGETRKTAVIEVAQIVGLPDARVPVGDRTTAGIGKLIAHLLDAGIRHIEIGLGGTSTNDAGVGMLCALGARILDRHGVSVPPTLASLNEVKRVDLAHLDARLREAELVLLSDVSNPLCGSSGATRVFGPQKGLASEQLLAVDETLRRFAGLCDEEAGKNCMDQPGAGAAGGLGYALLLLGARCVPGAMRVAELACLPEKLRDADRVLTGEGRSDRQTLMGKVPHAVAMLARTAGVRATLISGSIDQHSLPELLELFDSCHAIKPPGMTLAQAMMQTETLLHRVVEQIFLTPPA